MIKLLLVLLLFSTNALAGGIETLSEKEITAMYRKAMNVSSDKEKIYIKKNTMYCKTAKSLLDGYNYARENSGMVNKGVFIRMGCQIMDGASVGIVADASPNGKMVLLLFEAPFADQVSYGYFNVSDLRYLSEIRK